MSLKLKMKKRRWENKKKKVKMLFGPVPNQFGPTPDYLHYGPTVTSPRAWVFCPWPVDPASSALSSPMERTPRRSPNRSELANHLARPYLPHPGIKPWRVRSRLTTPTRKPSSRGSRLRRAVWERNGKPLPSSNCIDVAALLW